MQEQRNSQWAGRVVMVTGAASGIGEATAEAFAREGAQTILVDLQAEAGHRAAARIRDRGYQADFYSCDLGNGAEIRAMFDELRAKYLRLDVAFNNAGIEGVSAPVAAVRSEDWDRTIRVNLTGIFECMKAEIPWMLEAKRGAIVNCASIAGVRGFPQMAPYVASKHAVIGLTRAVALEVAAQGIRVNAVCPGVIRTPMIDRYTGGTKEAEAALLANEPIGRLGVPSDIANAVLWLASERASFVTGTEVFVDGGWCAK